jgi:hypothetical protein
MAKNYVFVNKDRCDTSVVKKISYFDTAVRKK